MTTKTIPVLALTMFSGYCIYRSYTTRSWRNVRSKVVELCDSIPDGLAQQELVTEEFPAVTTIANTDTTNVQIINDLPTEQRHRRLPHTRKSRVSYAACVIAEVKNKVGTLSDRESNRLVVRRLARGIMEVHGLRPTHIATILPAIIEACLTPNVYELDAHNWGNSPYVQHRKNFGRDHYGWGCLDWVYRYFFGIHQAPSNGLL